MKLLANENFPFPSIKILREAGFDVKSIAESNASIKDYEVLAIAVEEERVILTFDRDYGELIFKYKFNPPPAVVYFRVKGKTPEDAAQIFLNLIKTENILLVNYFTVIDEDGTRQRKLR